MEPQDIGTCDLTCANHECSISGKIKGYNNCNCISSCYGNNCNSAGGNVCKNYGVCCCATPVTAPYTFGNGCENCDKGCTSNYKFPCTTNHCNDLIII